MYKYGYCGSSWAMLLLLSEIPYMVLCVLFDLPAKLWFVRQELINLEIMEENRTASPVWLQSIKTTNYTVTKCWNLPYCIALYTLIRETPNVCLLAFPQILPTKQLCLFINATILQLYNPWPNHLLTNRHFLQGFHRLQSLQLPKKERRNITKISWTIDEA